MTHIESDVASSKDLEGSIFLPENRIEDEKAVYTDMIIAQFLSLRGDPDQLLDLLASIIQQPYSLLRIYERLKVSVMMSRGLRREQMAHIHDVESQARFYSALQRATEGLRNSVADVSKVAMQVVAL